VRLTPDTIVFDIETAPGLYALFQSGKMYVPPESCIEEPGKIICIAYKWWNKKRTHCLTWDENQDDKAMIEEFVEIANSADILVAHNGDQFDIKTIRTRCLKHRIAMMPNYTSIDTLKNCRALFRMQSNKLNMVAKFLGIPGKMQTGGIKLWLDVTFGKCPKAFNKMIRYCRRDVTLLEEVFDILNPYMPMRSRVNTCITLCPWCGSNRLSVNQRRKYTALGTERVSLKCLDCGKYPPAIAASRWDAAVAAV